MHDVNGEPKVRGLLLQTGYVESQALSLVPVYHKEGFETREEARDSFAQSFIKAIKAVYNPQRCPHCKEILREDHATAADHFRHLAGMDIDGSAWIYDYLERSGWYMEGCLVPGRYFGVSNFDAYLDYLTVGSDEDDDEEEGVPSWSGAIDSAAVIVTEPEFEED